MNLYDLFEQVIAHDIPRSKYDYEDVESFTDIADGSLKPKITTVNPRKLQATQDWIDTTRGGGKPRFEQYTKYPVIFKDEDGYHILDGHHRTYAALNRGDSKIKVYLFTRLAEASFADLKKMVPVYHVNEWSQELGIPRKVAYLYGELGFLQRSKPEQIMVKVQHFMGGGGVVPFCLEHVGDLSDRMTPRHPLHWSYGAVKEKAEKTYRSLTHSYGFEREFQENLDATIEYQKIENPDEYRERVYRAMKMYADAHKELLPYCHTNIHKNAVYAAIMLGERKFDDAAKFVGEIKRICASEESYHNALRAYDKKLDAKLAGEEVLDEAGTWWDQIKGIASDTKKAYDTAVVAGPKWQAAIDSKDPVVIDQGIKDLAKDLGMNPNDPKYKQWEGSMRYKAYKAADIKHDVTRDAERKAYAADPRHWKELEIPGYDEPWVTFSKPSPRGIPLRVGGDKVDETETLKLKKSNKDRANAWIEKVYARFPHTFNGSSVMVWGDGDNQQFAMFDLVPSPVKDGAVDIKWLQAVPQRQGVGSRALKVLQDMAREDGITLTLHPWSKGKISQSQLTKFYKKQGFKNISKGDEDMVWSP